MPKKNQNGLKQNLLGQTGISISEIGLGTVKFGRSSDVKYPTKFSIPSDRELRNLLDTAKSLGINYLDTAPAYGSSEQTLGRLIKHEREAWIVSTKVGEYYDNNVSVYDYTKEAINKSVKTSLQRLGLNELDIVYVHSNGEDSNIIQSTDVLPALEELKRKGLIRAIGFSGKDVNGSSLALDHCDVFMITLNQSDRSQTQLIDTCRKRGRGVVIKKALASGHLQDPAAALQFVNQYPGVDSAIVGTINHAHLTANVAAVV